MKNITHTNYTEERRSPGTAPKVEGTKSLMAREDANHVSQGGNPLYEHSSSRLCG